MTTFLSSLRVARKNRSEEINQHASRAGLNHLRMEKIKAGEYDDMSDDDL